MAVCKSLIINSPEAVGQLNGYQIAPPPKLYRHELCHALRHHLNLPTFGSMRVFGGGICPISSASASASRHTRPLPHATCISRYRVMHYTARHLAHRACIRQLPWAGVDQTFAHHTVAVAKLTWGTHSAVGTDGAAAARVVRVRHQAEVLCDALLGAECLAMSAFWVPRA